MSAIMKLVKKLEAMENRARRLSSKEVVVGWADDAKEPSEDGKPGASLATIAKTLCYGREGGKTKSGREYGRIPARNFVEVLKNKHSRLIRRIVADEVIKNGADGDIDMVRIGVIAKGQMQRAMKDSNEYAPNSPFTVNGGWMANPVTGKPFHADPKKSSRPLIDTGTLVNSVDFEIKSK